MTGDKEQKEETAGQPPRPDGDKAAAPKPREISRKEIDHQQPADPDPDDPVSP